MSDEHFTCVDCGKQFTSLAPPAETRKDDPEPLCCPCIEKQMDEIDVEPLTEETIERIISVVLRK